ncbi:MAG: leucine-rich repeat protein [Fibrobacter sp.]|nr:leucine-rich repeat protein [Fibrobacter sp.]
MKNSPKLLKITVATLLLVWGACNSPTSSSSQNSTTTSTVDSTFNLNDGVWDFARIDSAVALFPDNGTVIFHGNFTEDMEEYAQNAIKKNQKCMCWRSVWPKARDCGGITKITITKSSDGFNDINDVLFSKDGKTLYSYPLYIFETSYEIPSSVTTIGKYAFYGYSGLKSITIPSSVTSIESWQFDKCSNIDTVFYTGTKEQWGNINIGSGNEVLINATIICSGTE